MTWPLCVCVSGGGGDLNSITRKSITYGMELGVNIYKLLRVTKKGKKLTSKDLMISFDYIKNRRHCLPSIG